MGKKRREILIRLQRYDGELSCVVVCCFLYFLFLLFFYAFDVDLLFKLNAQGLNAMEFILEKIRKIAGDS
jgi:hypothetical protein